MSFSSTALFLQRSYGIKLCGGIALFLRRFGISLAAWAILSIKSSNLFWPVPMVFGFASISVAMPVSGCIATGTAFAVGIVTFLPPVLAWLLPGFVGSILLAQSTLRYTRSGSPSPAVKPAGKV